MSLVDYAKTELKAAGLFEKDSDYAGMLGESVLELVAVFAKQGHSGCSAEMAISAFSRLARFQPLTSLKNPAATGEYVEHEPDTWQSTRRYSVFSADKGKTWYDIDKRVPWWKKLFGVKRHYITFA